MGMICLCLFSIITGALARRHWGGWGNSNKYVRGVAFFALGIAISLLACVLTYGQQPPLVALICWGIMGLIPQASIWFVKGHGWAQGMGTWPDHTFPLCRVIFLGNYAIALALQGVILSFLIAGHAPQILVIIGLMTWIPHWLTQQVDFGKIFGLTMRPADQGYFYDSRTIWGELGLGAIMFGGLPAALLVEKFCAQFLH